MAHVRKDTRVAPREWWKHLRPFNKRLMARAERQAAKGEITDELVRDDPPAGLGLHNDPKAMARLKAEKGEDAVPSGSYCYDESGFCPYWDKATNGVEKGDGYCWMMGKGDWDEGVGELHDQCKCCGIRDEWAPEWTMPVGKEKPC